MFQLPVEQTFLESNLYLPLDRPIATNLKLYIWLSLEGFFRIYRIGFLNIKKSMP
jgi:hypothetical protein